MYVYIYIYIYIHIHVSASTVPTLRRGRKKGSPLVARSSRHIIINSTVNNSINYY